MAYGASDPLALPRFHRAVQAPDGTVRVPGVPIFGENQRFSPDGQVASFGPSWLRQAVQKDRDLRSTGYAAPLHFGHHEPGVVREPAGHVEFDSVGLRYYCGEPTWILFGTLVFKDTKKFEKAKSDYPYRSVEISNEKPDEINSLALLDTEAPFFRFPNLMTYSAAGSGVSNFLWRHKLLMSATNFETKQLNIGGASPLPVPPKDPLGSSIDDRAPKGVAPVKSAEGANPAPDIKHSADGDEGPEKFGGGGDEGGAPKEDGPPKGEGQGAPGEQDPMAGGGMNDLGARIAKLEALVMKLCSADAMMGMGAGAGVDMAGGQKRVPIVSAGAAGVQNYAAQLAKIEGMFAAQSAATKRLEKELAARDERDLQFSTIRSELEPYGIPNLDREIKVRQKDGTLAVWASTVKQFGRKEARSDEPGEANDAPEVAKYAEKGPEALSQARRLASLYSASPKRSLVRNNGLAAFLASNIKLED